VTREVLYNILVEFGITMKVVRLIGMCLNERNSEVRRGKYVSDSFPVRNALKEDALSPLRYNIALEYAIRKVQENQVGLKLNWARQLLAYDDDGILLRSNIHTRKKSTGTKRRESVCVADSSPEYIEES
jgi:hypothetical protein